MSQIEETIEVFYAKVSWRYHTIDSPRFATREGLMRWITSREPGGFTVFKQNVSPEEFERTVYKGSV